MVSTSAGNVMAARRYTYQMMTSESDFIVIKGRWPLTHYIFRHLALCDDDASVFFWVILLSTALVARVEQSDRFVGACECPDRPTSMGAVSS